MEKFEISVVSPVYRAQGAVGRLVESISSAVEIFTHKYEIILVEDGSADSTWREIKGLCAQNPRVKAARFSRNFGQHFAITAGLQISTGKAVVVIDCDLQDDPIYIQDMYKKFMSGSDLVLTVKNARQHGLRKNLLAKLFGLVFNRLTKVSVKYRQNIGNYSLLSRRVVDSFLKVHDYHRHYLMILAWLGYDPAYIEIEHRERAVGKSTYTFTKLLRHALDGITSQSDRLLYGAIIAGGIFFVLSILCAAAIIFGYFVYGFLQGWTSLAVVILLSTGFILLFLGILGIYLGKVFEQVKGRPLYIISETCNF